LKNEKMKNEEGVDHPSSFFILHSPCRGTCLSLIVVRLITHLDHLAPAIRSTALADVMRAHKLATLRAWHQGWRSEPLVLAAIAAAMARNFGFWCGTHID
jgi:hypothetical protein